MERRRELSEFERGMIVGARRMGCPISEVVRELNIPRSTVSRVYREYLIQGVTSHSGQRSGRPRLLNDDDRQRLAGIACANSQATLSEITCIFNAEAPAHVSRRSVQRSLASMGYRSRRPPRESEQSDESRSIPDPNSLESSHSLKPHDSVAPKTSPKALKPDVMVSTESS
ncbi:hypothetical protein GDO78_004144 [Eleutherodactylus coqui]|uniref:Transposase Tc1-like domain-containing protein n=1 Tax=Eleutherodactylus coqui TaxID=57060 RepID=A0A8J6ERG8_ELECQ|nr:hypothetical protein GDO78_004144 [Eleutherodactylus coqui]